MWCTYSRTLRIHKPLTQQNQYLRSECRLASTGRECLAGRRPAPEQNTFEGLGLESISMQYTSPVFITEVCAQTLLSQVPGLWRTWRQVQESNHWHASCMPLGSCTR